MQTTVSLKKTEFYAYHGYYPEEKLTGNRFIVNLSVSFAQKEKLFVNYEHLFTIVHDVFIEQEPVDFLETLVQQIIKKCQEKYGFIDVIDCEIIKVKPPIAKFNGEGTSVQMKWKK